MKLYKLTDANGQTRGNTQWGENVTHKATGNDADLCSDGWIHAYESPLLAVLLNPIHADFRNPILWEAEGELGKRDGQLKCGVKKLTTIQKLPLPQISTTQQVAFAILAAKQIYKKAEWNSWADDWLNGKDRSQKSAEVAAAAIEAERRAASASARAASAGTAAARALASASVAASAVAAASVVAAAEVMGAIDLIAIAEQAMTYV